MFHDLEILNDFVSNKLNPLKNAAETVEILEGWHSIILEEGHKVKMNIAAEALKLPDGAHIKVYIQNYQHQLISLANQLYSYNNYNKVVINFPTKEPITLHNLQSIAYETIEDLIDYLKISFDNYFLFEEKPPRRKILIAVLQFTESINNLQALSNEPNVYLNAVVKTASDLIHCPEKITFHKIDFLLSLAESIINFPHQAYEKDLTLFIKYHFLHLNFNCVHVKLLFTDEYSGVLMNLKSVNEKLEKISWYLKRITQAQVQSEMTYEPKERALKEHISHWLIEELSFLEKNNIIAKLQEEAPDPNAKVMFNMSVAQLGCFLKFLVDAEVIKSANYTELVKLVARGSRTKGTGNISAESLRIKFYDIEESTKDDIKAMIINLLNIVKNHRNYIILLHASFFQADEAIHSLAVLWQQVLITHI